MQTSFPGQQWLEALSVRQGRARELLAKAVEEQHQSGYFHTLPEICRQPQTWRETCELMIKSTAAVNASLRGAKSLIFTGSGGSEYAGDCFKRVVYLGSGARYGAAREAALKMLEMTAGRVSSLYESYLGLRQDR